jgi:hypothetical protein
MLGRESGMAPADPDEGGSETLHPVLADMGVATEFGGAVRTDVPIPDECIATIRASTQTQIEWLDAIEAALCELRRRQIQDSALVEAAAVATRLRAAITAPQSHGKSVKLLWLCLYGCISVPFLEHYSSAVGDDLGHATAHKIIEVLSNLSHYLKL